MAKRTRQKNTQLMCLASVYGGMNGVSGQLGGQGTDVAGNMLTPECNDLVDMFLSI